MRLKGKKNIPSGTKRTSIVKPQKRQTLLSRLVGALKRWFRYWPVVLGCGLILWVLLWVGASGFLGSLARDIHYYTANQLARYGYVIETVKVTGRHYTDPLDLKAALAIEAGQPILSVDLQGASVRVQELEWVETVVIKRLWPDRIEVHLTERQPLAVWRQGDGERDVLLDRGGTAMMVPINKMFDSLLRVSGEDAPMALPDLIGLLLAEPEILNHLKEAKRISGRRWDLILRDGGTVRLPEEDVGYALSRLMRMHTDNSVLDKAFSEIDLRLNDRMIIDHEQ